MKNAINYYYNLFPEKISNSNNYYYFYIDNEKYELVIYKRKTEEADSLYKFNNNLVNKNITVHKIIKNKDNNVITIINNIPYVLYKVYINEEKKVTLSEISYLSNLKIDYEKELMRSNWSILWSSNIDYFEYQISQNGKKYPIIVDTFSYYVGLAENAISYVNNTVLETKQENADIGVLAHKKIRLNDRIYELYNPLNTIIDHKARDLAEYIKLSFFKNNKNIFNELDIYFKYNYYSIYGIRLLFGRILYPSYYFDLYEDIVTGEKEEKEILQITTKIEEFEDYLYDIYYYLRKFYQIPEVTWLTKKRGTNPHLQL